MDTGYAINQRVTVVVNTPEGKPVNGTIRVIQDKPGKIIGVELDDWTNGTHSLDGELKEFEDNSAGVVVSKGWWTRPEYIAPL